MSITIFRTVEMKEHKSSGLPTADVPAIVEAIRAAGLDEFFAEFGAVEGLLVDELDVDQVEAALAPLSLLPETREILAETIAHARENVGNKVNFVQYREGGPMSFGSHPLEPELRMANGNAYALFDALGLQLDGACGSFTAQTMLEAANRLSPVGGFADYRERLIAVCEAAIAKSGPTAMLTAA